MACHSANAINRAEVLCVHPVAIPEKYRRSGDGILPHTQPWLNSEEASGYFTFGDYVGTWAHSIMFSDENTAIFFKLRFG